MKTVYEIIPVGDCTSSDHAIAATIEAAEKYLSDNGFECITQSDEPFYQTWLKTIPGNELVLPTTKIMTVKKYKNFIE